MFTRMLARTAVLLVLALALGPAAFAPGGDADRQQQPAKPRNIGSHTGGIASTHFSPCGKFLATGGGDRMVRVWDVAAGKAVHEWNGPTSFTCAVRFSPDGKLLAAAGYEVSQGNPIYLFDLTTGKEKSSLTGHPTGGVRRLAFSPDGKALYSAGFDGTLRCWDVASGKETRVVKVESGTVYDLAVSSDGKTIVTAGREGLKLWEAATGKAVTVKEPMAKHSAVSVALSADGKLVASGDGAFVKVWEVATGREVRTLEGYKGEVAQVLFSRDGRVLYSASYDRTVRLWEVRTGKLIHQAEHHTGWVWGISLSPDEKQLASCSVDTWAVCWDLAGLTGSPTGKAARLSPDELDRHWKQLGGKDAGAAYRAVWALAGDPGNSLPVLQERLLATRQSGPTTAEINRLIADLDADFYRAREKASKDLANLGARALPAVKAALLKPQSVEAQLRLKRLVARLDPTALPPEELVAVRGVQALEYMATPQAVRLLKELARSDGYSRLCEEANLALARLKAPR